MRALALAICVVFGLVMPGYAVGADVSSKNGTELTLEQLRDICKYAEVSECEYVAKPYQLAYDLARAHCGLYSSLQDANTPEKVEQRDLHKELCLSWTEKEAVRLRAIAPCMCAIGCIGFCKE